MAVFLFLAALLLCFNGYSSATYCLCKDGVGDSALQKSIDYACGSGADCSAILQNGGCFQPNTVKSHCDYAVNSYYQRKGQAIGSCDFSGTATLSTVLPSTVGSGCTYLASPSQVGSNATTPTTGIPTTGTPSTTAGTPSTTAGTPSTTTGTPSTTTSGTPSITSPTSGVYGIGNGVAPTGYSDSSSQDFQLCPLPLILTLLFSSLLLSLV
ncbi:hypothetical protein Dimus_031236 [Dionaea muscipula]